MGLAIRIGKDPDLLEAAGCLTQEKRLPNETQTSARAQKRRSGPPPDVAPGISNSVLLRRSPQCYGGYSDRVWQLQVRR
jgi:hypothetical protein